MNDHNCNFKNIELDSDYMNAYFEREKHKQSAELKLAIVYSIIVIVAAIIIITYLVKNWSLKHLFVGIAIQYAALIPIVLIVTKIANKLFSLHMDQYPIVMWMSACLYLSAYFDNDLRLKGNKNGQEFDLSISEFMNFMPYYKYNVYGRPKMKQKMVPIDLTHQDIIIEEDKLKEEQMTLKICVNDAPRITFEIIEKETA